MNIPYNLFGLQLNEKEFEDYLQKAMDQEILNSVAMRVFFVDQLRYNAFFRQTPALMDGLTSMQLGTEKTALQLYLLCTCVDALSGSKYIEFINWLELRDTQINKIKYGLDGQKISQILREISGNLDDPNIFKSAVLRMYREIYRPTHGIQNSFLRFFSDLPINTQEILAQVYIISGLLSKNDISMELNDTQTLPRDIESWNKARFAWETKDLPSKIKLIADYFYNYYRNPYTHQAVSPSPRTTEDWSEILTNMGGELPGGAWDPIGDVIPYGKKYKIRRFWAKPYEDEVFWLRLIVAIGWRYKAGMPVEGDLTENFRKFQMRNEIMHYAMYELEEIRLLQKQYLGEIHDKLFAARVSLPKFSLRFLLMLKQYLNDSPLERGLKSMIDGLQAEIGSVHLITDEFNQKYNLVFPNTLNIQMDPIQRATVLSEKDKIILQIRDLLAKSRIEYTTHKLYEWFDQLVDRMT